MAEIDNALFSEQELEDLKGGLFSGAEENGPVTVLGMTFTNNEERRAYFREELRKKLPELKYIEGYPIGSDDDIINLSDPPYYTACPNPWIKDIIAEWENEKRTLCEHGERIADKVVTEPYASDVSEGKNNPIYNAHSYHTKVPHPAIMRYILHYTEPGDIIYDGFAGTGMTGVASSFCESPQNDIAGKIQSEFKNSGKLINWGSRHAILSDLSPVASLICGTYNTKRTKSALKRVEAVINSVQEKYDWMYKTTHTDGTAGVINYIVWSDVFICPHCGSEVIFFDTAVNHETNEVYKDFNCSNCNGKVNKNTLDRCWESSFDYILNESVRQQKKVPVLINYSVGKKTYNKKPDAQDLAIIEKARTLTSTFSFVSNRMMEGTEARRNDRQGLTHVHHFYFFKSLVILEQLLKECDTIEMRFVINSQLVNISKLNRYRPGISFPYNPLSGTLYIGSQISEANVFTALKNKLKKLSVAFDSLSYNNLTSVSSATSAQIPDNSIDYIFTDPPFGANFSYSELNYLQESWLKVCTNIQDEAIVNESHHKGRDEYQSLMTASLKEYYRVLKPGKWITIEFSNTSAAIWNAIQQAIESAGFVVANVSALDKQQGSFKAVTTTTAVKQDLVISCFKPSDLLLKKILESNDYNASLWDFVDEYLSHLPVHISKGDSTASIVERSPKILFDRLISYFVQKGLPVPIDASAFQAGLRERYIERDGMFFTSSQVAEYDEKRRLSSDFISLGLIVSTEGDGIEWLNNQLRYNPKTYQEIMPEWMQAISGVRKGDILPELKDILDENFIQEPDGKWRLPNIQDDVDKFKLRTKALLKEFKLYVEQASKPKAKIKEVRVEAIRAGFKQCYIDKDFQTIVTVGDKIPQNLLEEDEILLQFYDIAVNHI